MDYMQAYSLANHWKRKLAPYCDRVEIAGSIRRHKADPKDIELCCIPKRLTVNHSNLFETKFVNGARHPGFISALRDEEHIRIEMGKPEDGKYVKCMLPQGIKMDVFICTADNWGYLFAIRTGPSEYSHKVLANRWCRKGYYGHDGMLMRDNVPVPLYEEEDLYKLLEIPMPLPENRRYP